MYYYSNPVRNLYSVYYILFVEYVGRNLVWWCALCLGNAQSKHQICGMYKVADQAERIKWYEQYVSRSRRSVVIYFKLVISRDMQG